MSYGKYVQSRRATPQTQPIPGRTDMVPNDAGGYNFKLNPIEALRRFVILGSNVPTYYVSDKELTMRATQEMIEVAKTRPVEGLKVITDVSIAGRAPKNDPALYALAVLLQNVDHTFRPFILNAIPVVARTGSSWLQLASYMHELGGWSSAKRRAFIKMFDTLDPENLAYQMLKYRSRNGWSQRDLLRLTHPKTDGPKNVLFKFLTSGDYELGGPKLLDDFVALRAAGNTRRVIDVLEQNRSLSWEMIPTQFLKDRDVWATLLNTNLPMGALLRNLGRLTSIGVLGFDLSDEVETVVRKFSNAELLKKSRLHPMTILNAQRVYEQGYGDKGTLRWNPSRRIREALESAFYLSFGAVETTNERYLIAVDVSGSMTMAGVAGSQLRASEVATAMAMVTLKAEPRTVAVGFSTKVVPLPIAVTESLQHNMRSVYAMTYGATDTAAALEWLIKNKHDVDKVVVISDGQGYAGHRHLSQALQDYENKVGHVVKVVIVATTAGSTTLADPTRSDMLDVVGFDTAVPNLIAEF